MVVSFQSANGLASWFGAFSGPWNSIESPKMKGLLVGCTPIRIPPPIQLIEKKHARKQHTQMTSKSIHRDFDFQDIVDTYTHTSIDIYTYLNTVYLYISYIMIILIIIPSIT